MNGFVATRGMRRSSFFPTIQTASVFSVLANYSVSTSRTLLSISFPFHCFHCTSKPRIDA